MGREVFARRPGVHPRGWWCWHVEVSLTLAQIIFQSRNIALSEDLSLLVHSYEHHNVQEPAILLGGSFVVNISEKGVQPS